MLNVRKHWNKKFLGYPKSRKSSSYAKDKEKFFPKNSVVCDLGGGDGTDALYFLEKGHKVQLFDVSDVALKIAYERAKSHKLDRRLTIGRIDLGKDDIPIEDNSVDVVYSRLSLHFFSLERLKILFSEIIRILKSGGRGYIVVKSPEDKREMAWLEKNTEKIEKGIYSEGGMIKTRFTKKQYKKLLRSVGIKNFKIGDYIEKFGDQKIFVKSKADELLYIEVIIKK